MTYGCQVLEIYFSMDCHVYYVNVEILKLQFYINFDRNIKGMTMSIEISKNYKQNKKYSRKITMGGNFKIVFYMCAFHVRDFANMTKFLKSSFSFIVYSKITT